MQDPSDSTETTEPEEEGGRTVTTVSPGTDGPEPDPQADAEPVQADAEPVSTVLAEIIPGVAVVFGKVPAELRPGLVDFGLVSAADRTQISTVLASLGSTATAAGHLKTAFTGAQGLYRLGSATQSLLNAGATLAVKDGANLGAVFLNGRIIAQARLLPVAEVGAATRAANIGPALAMVAMQMQLTEITGLVRTNIALTSQVLTAIRNEQWAELTGLVAVVDRAIDQARELESVPTSLWEDVAGSGAALEKQLELYRHNVRGHVAEIDLPDARRRREYLQTNAEAIVFDSHALLSSVKAWTGYQALRAARASAAGREDAAEARYADVIVRDTRAELDSALTETTRLLHSLTRELRTIAELPGRGPLSQSLLGKRRDAKAARDISARLLGAIVPLADALHPPATPLEVPDILCAPESLDPAPYLRVLRWFLENGEILRALAFPEQLDALGPISAIIGGAKEKLAATIDKSGARTLVAVTDRRIIMARTNEFLGQGEIRQDVPVDRVRYVRAANAQVGGDRSAIDLITRDESIRWLFRAEIDSAHVDALAAVLAESMAIPEIEREDLQRRRRTPVDVGQRDETTRPSTAAEPTEAEATTGDTE
ncbi:hypothetical protein AB0442_39655 [Kitasatospora sp. NPDC085895]|uniref:hypothetical protein n=1 Tax=Kitasatospora sp. NPDC085895 TaxID=3155057 RepID=UPI003450363E